MGQTLTADQVTLYDLEQRFQLEKTEDESFFWEWQQDLPLLTEIEQQRLQRIRAIVDNLEQRSVLENTIKLAVIAPLLDLAGLFLPPFYVSTEDSIEIEAHDQSLVVRGRIDVLVWKDQLWVLVIESKRAEFSLKVGIPQVLIFLKLLFQAVPRYAKSRQFVLGQDHDLERVLQILKRLAEIVRQNWTTEGQP